LAGHPGRQSNILVGEEDLLQKCLAMSNSRRIDVKELGAMGSDVPLTWPAQQAEHY